MGHIVRQSVRAWNLVQTKLLSGWVGRLCLACLIALAVGTTPVGYEVALGSLPDSIPEAACGLVDETAEQDPSTNADSAQTRLTTTGVHKGAYVPTFYARVVTGPLMNKSVCYVCRNGSRPVVMVVMRRTDADLGLLLRNIERIVDRRRARGVRCVGVLISKEPFKSVSQVQTFAFDAKLKMPLTVATDAVALPDCLNIPDTAVATVLMYKDRTVMESKTLTASELNKPTFKRLLQRIQAFADSDF